MPSSRLIHTRAFSCYLIGILTEALIGLIHTSSYINKREERVLWLVWASSIHKCQRLLWQKMVADALCIHTYSHVYTCISNTMSECAHTLPMMHNHTQYTRQQASSLSVCNSKNQTIMNWSLCFVKWIGKYLYHKLTEILLAMLGLFQHMIVPQTKSQQNLLSSSYLGLVAGIFWPHAWLSWLGSIAPFLVASADSVVEIAIPFHPNLQR